MRASSNVQRGWLRRQLMARNGFPLAALFLISLVSNLLMLTGPLFMLQVYDRVLTSRSLPTLVALTLLVVVLYGFYALVEWLRARMATRFAAAIDEYLSGEVFRAGVRLRLRPAGAGVADPVRDLDALRQFVAGPGPLALLDLPWLPAYLAIVFLFHPLLGWLATAGAAVMTVLLVVNELFSRKPSEELTRATTRRTGQSDDARLNAEPILAMGMLDAVTERWRQAAAALVAAQHRAADWTALHSSITKAFRFLLQSAVLALGAYLVIAGEITSGLMIAASIVTSRALAPVEQVVGQWRGFLNARQALRRVGDVLEKSGGSAPRTTLPRPHRNLVVHRMATAPDRYQPPVVSGIDFALEAGEGLGILGLSGSGKTSIARAIVGVWPLLQGTVRLDGSELSHYHPEQLGAAVGYLPQVVDLFDGTVAENISRFDREATSEKILRASAQARTHELIASLPEGYDTQLGPRGAILSAGQRQRIGLARALYGDPFLVVLDEPNSNLDQEGDAALTEALLEARERGAVVVVVAHRPSAVAALNKLLYVRGGRQAGFGPKEEVLHAIAERPAATGGRRAHG